MTRVEGLDVDPDTFSGPRGSEPAPAGSQSWDLHYCLVHRIRVGSEGAAHPSRFGCRELAGPGSSESRAPVAGRPSACGVVSSPANAAAWSRREGAHTDRLGSIRGPGGGASGSVWAGTTDGRRRTQRWSTRGEDRSQGRMDIRGEEQSRAG